MLARRMLMAAVVNNIGPIVAGESHDFDLRLGNVGVHSFVCFTQQTLSDPTPITFSKPPPAGTAGTLTLRFRNVGLLNVIWPASVRWPGGVVPELTGNGPGYDWLSFITLDGGTTWYGVAAGLNML